MPHNPAPIHSYHSRPSPNTQTQGHSGVAVTARSDSPHFPGHTNTVAGNSPANSATRSPNHSRATLPTRTQRTEKNGGAGGRYGLAEDSFPDSPQNGSTPPLLCPQLNSQPAASSTQAQDQVRQHDILHIEMDMAPNLKAHPVGTTGRHKEQQRTQSGRLRHSNGATEFETAGQRKNS